MERRILRRLGEHGAQPGGYLQLHSWCGVLGLRCRGKFRIRTVWGRRARWDVLVDHIRLNVDD